MIQARSTQETITILSEMLRNEERVFFSRFGDGDVFIMDGRDQANHVCTDELRREMISAFKVDDPKYLKALSVNYPKEQHMCRGCFAPFPTNDYLAEVVRSVLGSDPARPFENPVVFHYMSIFYPEIMNSFLDEFIRGRRILFVGGQKSDVVEKVLGKGVVYVATPLKNAYHYIDEWWPEVLSKVEQADVLIPSAGMASRIINKRLWDLGTKIHSIDIGSLFDAVAGIRTRTWIQLVGHRIDEIVLPEYRRHDFFSSSLKKLYEAKFFVKKLYR